MGVWSQKIFFSNHYILVSNDAKWFFIIPKHANSMFLSVIKLFCSEKMKWPSTWFYCEHLSKDDIRWIFSTMNTHWLVISIAHVMYNGNKANQSGKMGFFEHKQPRFPKKYKPSGHNQNGLSFMNGVRMVFFRERRTALQRESWSNFIQNRTGKVTWAPWRVYFQSSTDELMDKLSRNHNSDHYSWNHNNMK